MQILSIQLKNIKSHRETELRFAPGINVLSGPNGVGKSTIFEAIGYALFGVDAQSFVGNVERFLSIGAKRGEVAVVFQLDNGQRYRVSRTVGTPSRWLLARELGAAFEVEEHKDARETEGRLKQLLGLDNGRPLADQFTLVIGPFQHEFLGPFVIKQAAKRRDEFDAILGIDTWRKTFNETNALLKAIKARVDALESALGPLREQVAVLPERVEAYQGASASLAQAERDLLLQQQKLIEADRQLGEFDRREEQLKALSVDLDKLRERLENGRDKIARQQALIGEAETAARVIAANQAGKLAYEQAERRLAALRSQEKQRRQLEKEQADLDKQLAAWTERHTAEQAGIERVRRELREEQRLLAERRSQLAVDEAVKQRAERLPQLRGAIREVQAEQGKLEGKRAGLEEGQDKLAEGICPFFQEPCLNIAERPPGDVFSASLAALAADHGRLSERLGRLEGEEAAAVQADQQLKALAVQQKELETQVTRLAGKHQANEGRTAELAKIQQERERLRQQLAELLQALQQYDGLQARIEGAEGELKQHQAARDLFVANQAQAAQLEGRQAELVKFEQLLAQLRQQATDKEQELRSAAAGYDAPRHQDLRAQKEGLGREVGALGEKVVRFQADVERLAGEIGRLRRVEQEIAGKQAQIKAYGAKEELVKFLRNRVFRQVSGYLSERFREEISRRADRIYRTIAESDEELLWGENYQVILRDLQGGEVRERSDDQLSGGQMMSAVVSLRLALLQTIGARIAFFDEPTSNLDAARRENLARAFRAIDVGREEVTEHWYDQLFLVSHDVAFTEITDQVVELGK